ncbi:MAG: MATE family efflux transporter [Burkholderiales bacterium]|nr:MAG: MATE family efflux transporter [Burkholderiales bacterium]
MTKDILKLAWPVFVGQIAVMLNGVIDTIMAGRLSAVDVAAIGLGASIYISVYIGLMGVLVALSPVVAQHYGARRYEQIGLETRQAGWLALLLAIPGCLALASSDLWLALSDPPPEVAAVARPYLWGVAAGLPAALLFRVFHALSSAVALPRAVMTINLVGAALKVPLNALFMYGLYVGDTAIVPALGGAGCGVATAIIAWLSLLLALVALRAEPLYRTLGVVGGGGLGRPDPARLSGLLALGLPIGASYLVEVTSFTFMALFLARLGATTAASHQIAANLAALVYMLPLALATATSVLVAQSIGAARPAEARARAWAGLRIALGCALAIGIAVFASRRQLAALYTTDAGLAAAALPLLGLVAAFQLFDSAQAMCSFILRAYRITVLPMVVYVVSLWGIGLGGGWWLAFVAGASQRSWAPEVAGARGFWIAACASLAVAAAGLAAILARVWGSKQQERTTRTDDAGAATRASVPPRAQPGGVADRKRSR